MLSPLFIIDVFCLFKEQQAVIIPQNNCSINMYSNKILIHSKDHNKVYCEITTDEFYEKILSKIPPRDLIRLIKKHNIDPNKIDLFQEGNHNKRPLEN